MLRLILGFAGEMAAGKGTATDLVKSWYPNAPSFRFSDSLRKFYGLLLPSLCDTGIFHGQQLRTSEERFALLRIRTIVDHVFRSPKNYPRDDIDDEAYISFATWIIKQFIPTQPLNWRTNASTADLQNLSTQVRQVFGENTLLRAILADVAEYRGESPLVIIEGIRRAVDIEMLIANPSTPFRLTYIEAESTVRWERHRARNEKPGDRELTFLQFVELGKAEAESQIRTLRPVAHAVIDNSGPTIYLESKLRTCVTEWCTVL